MMREDAENAVANEEMGIERFDFLKLDDLKIMTTKNGDIFKFSEWNRDIDKNNVDSLFEEMKSTHIMTPILVSNDYTILDGQHRIEAMKRFKEEDRVFNYIILPDSKILDTPIDLMVSLNKANKPWPSSKIAQHREKRGEYLFSFLRSQAESTGLNQNHIYSLIVDKYEEAKIFKTTKFVLKEEDREIYDKKISDFMTHIRKISEVISLKGSHPKKGFLIFFLDLKKSGIVYTSRDNDKIVSMLVNIKNKKLISKEDESIYEFPSQTKFGSWKKMFMSIYNDSIYDKWEII